MNFDEKLERLKPYIKTESWKAVEILKSNVKNLSRGNLKTEDYIRNFNQYYESYNNMINDIIRECTHDLDEPFKYWFGIKVHLEVLNHTKEVDNIIP
ncbi:hypothetical protein VS868_09505 [Salinimicrobium sp. 3283s]|uniref:hypothetical protein n=1 Tax=Salinimicrobium sp. 3283s TaxID=3114359 RepID=UPI0031E86435